MANGKTPEETSVTMTELVLPGMTNLLGNLLGGQMMHWMDVAGALCCMRHCNMQVATIAVEALEFRHPVNILYANTKEIEGKAVGQMIIALPEDDRLAERMMGSMRAKGLVVEEVKGRV